MNDSPSPLVPASIAPPRAWLWAVRVLATAAFAISVYLFLASHGGGAAGCSGDGDCGAVLASRWSRWFSLPVTAPAAATYLLVLLTTFALPRNARAAWMLLVVLAVAITGTALWFIALQAFVLHRVCPYCMAAHGCGLALSALIVGRVAATRKRSESTDAARFSNGQLAALSAIGGLAVAILIAGQWFPRAQPSAIAFEKTTVSVDRAAFPSIGQPGARRFAAVFVDYTCGDCRRLHHVLERVLARHPGELAITVLPLPLDAECNRNLRHTHALHAHGCELARIALAVWRADTAQFAAMDRWFFENEIPPTPQQARTQAATLAGAAAFEAAARDPLIEETIRRSIDTFTRAGGRQLPALLLGSRTLTGRIAETPDVVAVIEKELGFSEAH